MIVADLTIHENMTRRKLKGPASARGNKKTERSTLTLVENAINDMRENEASSDLSDQTEDVDNSIKTENYPADDVGHEGGHDDGHDAIIDKTRQMLNEDEDEDDAADDLESMTGKLMSEDEDEEQGDSLDDRSDKVLDQKRLETNDGENDFVKARAVAELRKLANLLNAKWKAHNDQVKSLIGENSKMTSKVKELEAEKVDLSVKYKKYKDMAIKLKSQSSGASSASDKDLEEENQELKMKLKDLLDKLQNEEESKGDVNSKLHLKDVMLQKERIKYDNLENKFKAFLTKFHQKFDSSNPIDSMMSILQSFLAESRMDESFSSNQNRIKEANNPKSSLESLEPISERFNASDPSSAKESKSSSSKSLDSFKKSIQENISNASSSAKSSSKPQVEPPSQGKSLSKVKKSEATLNKTLPVPEASRQRPGPASRRKSIAMSKASSSVEVNKPLPQTVPPVSAKDIIERTSKPPPTTQSNNLPSKLLTNSSISFGSVSIEKKQEMQQAIKASSASSKLSKLGSINSSISFSPSSSGTPSSQETSMSSAPSIAKLSGNSSISMVKSSSPSQLPASSVSITKPQTGAAQDGSQLLKRQGISFSKVSSDPQPVVSSPQPKAQQPATKRLSNLKGLNISLSKPGAGSPAKPSSPATPGLISSNPTDNFSSALVPINNEEPPPTTASPKSRPRRGPASAKRKAETEIKPSHPSSKQRTKLLEETSPDEEEEMEQGKILSLTHESDQDQEHGLGDDFMKDYNDIDNDELMKKLQNVENELENQLQNLPILDQVFIVKICNISKHSNFLLIVGHRKVGYVRR